MKTSDLILTITIILTFIGIYLINLLGINIANIKKHWSRYRCNPLVMPFAGLFGYNINENFTYCIQNMHTSYSGETTNPIQYHLSNMNKTSTQTNSANQASRSNSSNIRFFFADIIKGVMGVFLNILIEIQKIVMSLKDIFANQIAIVLTLLYTLSGALMTMNSAWAGPPGQFVRALCFHPDTLVRTYKNKLVKMKNLKLGDKLKDGTIIQATMNIHNLDTSGNYIESLYSIDGGEKNKQILVSGSHLIFNDNNQQFIYVKDSPKSTISKINSKKLSCLITANHLIPLGKHIFHDWEDNNNISLKL